MVWHILLGEISRESGKKKTSFYELGHKSVNLVDLFHLNFVPLSPFRLFLLFPYRDREL